MSTTSKERQERSFRVKGRKIAALKLFTVYTTKRSGRFTFYGTKIEKKGKGIDVTREES